MRAVDSSILTKLRETRKGKEVERAYLCPKCETYVTYGATRILRTSMVCVWCSGLDCRDHTTLVVGDDGESHTSLLLDDGWEVAQGPRDGSISWICPSCRKKGRAAVKHLGTLVEVRLT